jgi:hypothetical protein
MQHISIFFVCLNYNCWMNSIPKIQTSPRLLGNLKAPRLYSGTWSPVWIALSPPATPTRKSDAHGAVESQGGTRSWQRDGEPPLKCRRIPLSILDLWFITRRAWPLSPTSFAEISGMKLGVDQFDPPRLKKQSRRTETVSSRVSLEVSLSHSNLGTGPTAFNIHNIAKQHVHLKHIANYFPLVTHQ